MEQNLPCEANSPRLSVTFPDKLFFYDDLLAPSPNSQAGGPSLVGCPLLFIQYIRSYPPYLEAVYSIRNPGTRHAVVTGTP